MWVLSVYSYQQSILRTWECEMACCPDDCAASQLPSSFSTARALWGPVWSGGSRRARTRISSPQITRHGWEGFVCRASWFDLKVDRHIHSAHGHSSTTRPLDHVEVPIPTCSWCCRREGTTSGPTCSEGLYCIVFYWLTKKIFIDLVWQLVIDRFDKNNRE